MLVFRFLSIETFASFSRKGLTAEGTLLPSSSMNKAASIRDELEINAALTGMLKNKTEGEFTDVLALALISSL
jgi:hypothetical protein